MPYSRNSDLPKGVRNALPEVAQTIWRNAFNSQDKRGLNESRSIQSAWGAVKNAGYAKGDGGKWVMEKKEGFKPTAAMAANAKRALAARGEKPASQKGMTSVGLARANQLINRQNLSLDTVKRMYSFFSRHEVDKKGSTWSEQGKGWQAWNGWGGDEGFTWAKAIMKREGLSKTVEFETNEKLLKAGEELGVVFAWAIITDKDGEQYHDKDGDHFSEDVALKSAYDYMMGARVINFQHTPKDVGKMVFGFPLTRDIAEHFGIESQKYGFIGGAKVDDATMKLFKNKKLKGFSIEGSYSAEDL